MWETFSTGSFPALQASLDWISPLSPPSTSPSSKSLTLTTVVRCNLSVDSLEDDYVIIKPARTASSYDKYVYDSMQGSSEKVALMSSGSDLESSFTDVSSKSSAGESVFQSRSSAMKIIKNFTRSKIMAAGGFGFSLGAVISITLNVGSDGTLSNYCTSRISMFNQTIKNFPLYEFNIQGKVFGLYHSLSDCTDQSNIITHFKVVDSAGTTVSTHNKTYTTTDEVFFAFTINLRKSLLEDDTTVQITLTEYDSSDLLVYPEHINATFYETLDIASPSFNFNHGVGNIRELEIPIDFITIFQYKYVSLSMAAGGLVTKIGSPGFADGRAPADVVGYSIIAYDGSPPPAGPSDRPLMCKNSTDMFTKYGCMHLPWTTRNCEDDMKNIQSLGCILCSGGYYKTSTTCDICAADCKLCSNGTSCLVCEEGYIRTYSNPNYQCSQYVQSPGYLYNPLLQSSYPSTTASLSPTTPQSYPYNITATTISLSASGAAVVKVRITFTSSAATNQYRFSDIQVHFGGSLVQSIPVQEYIKNPLATPPYIDIYFIKYSVPAGSYDVIITSRLEISQVTLDKFQEEYNSSSDCLVETSGGSCSVCNQEGFFYLDQTSGTCTATPTGKYSVRQGYNSYDSLYDCYQPSITLRCANSSSTAAYSCLSPYFLSPAVLSPLPDPLIGTCSNCTSPCSTCNLTATNCLTCISNYSLVEDPALLSSYCTSTCPAGTFSNQSNYCQLCDPSCLTCINSTGSDCSTCANGKYLDASSACVSCSTTNCVSCNSLDVCAACDTNYSLDGANNCVIINTQNTTDSSNRNTDNSYRRITLMNAVFDKRNNLYNLTFSERIDFRLLKDQFSLVYNKNLFIVNFTCNLSLSGAKIKTCSSPVTFKNGVEVNDEQITFEILDFIVIDSIAAIIEPSKISLDFPIRFFIDSLTKIKKIESAAKTTSTAVKVINIVSAVSGKSSAGAFGDVLKLTQYIEALVYLNLQFPTNFQSFIQHFTENILSFIFNPFQKYSEANCSPDWPFSQNGTECLYLQNNGNLFVLIASILGIKGVLMLLILACKQCPRACRLFTKCNRFLGIDFFAMLIDSLVFDLCMTAMVNLKKSKNSGSVYVTVSSFLSSITLLFYGLEILFLFIHSKYYEPEPIVFEQPLRFDSLGKPLQTTGKIEDSKFELMKLKKELSSSQLDKFEESRPVIRRPATIQQKNGFLQGIKKAEIAYLTETLNRKNFSGRYKFLILQLKTIATALSLVIFFKYPMIQVSSIAILQLIPIVIFMFKRPHDSFKENFKTLSTEILLSITMILCVLLLDDPTIISSTYDRYYYLGYTLICTVSLIFFIYICLVLVENYQTVKVWLKSKLKKNSVVIPETTVKQPSIVKIANKNANPVVVSPTNRGFRNGANKFRQMRKQMDTESIEKQNIEMGEESPGVEITQKSQKYHFGNGSPDGRIFRAPRIYKNNKKFPVSPTNQKQA